jgi:hypothetical protein
MKESGIPAQKLAMCHILSIPNPLEISELKAVDHVAERFGYSGGTSDADKLCEPQQ